MAFELATATKAAELAVNAPNNVAAKLAVQAFLTRG
jgi:hypothetical protein